MDLNNIANLFYKHSLVISFNHQLSNLMGFEGPFIGVMGRFNRAFWVLMGQSHHWKLEPVLPLMAEIARIYLHLLRGCSQPQAIWSPSWGVPWIHRTWRWLFFSMRTWRKSKWPTTATSYPTQLLVSLLTKWSTLIEWLIGLYFIVFIISLIIAFYKENRSNYYYYVANILLWFL